VLGWVGTARDEALLFLRTVHLVSWGRDISTVPRGLSHEETEVLVASVRIFKAGPPQGTE